jgi:hypothetical protein
MDMTINNPCWSKMAAPWQSPAADEALLKQAVG